MQQINKPYEGLFITVEGGDGCGKSTLAEKLKESLTEKGYCVFLTREPGGTPLSEKIRHILLSPEIKVDISSRSELLLFLAARAQNIEEAILPALRERKVVICDRFNDSSIVYQGCARHLGKHYVEQLCHLACEELAEPDFTLLLDIEPEEGLKRLAKRGTDRLDQEAIQFHKEARQGYLHLADEHSERFVVLDATHSPEQLLEEAMQALEPHLVLKPCTP